MSTPGISVAITAQDFSGPAFAAATVNAQAFQAGMERSAYSMREARGAAKLFSEEVGVGLNKHLAGVMAMSSALGPILSAAFPAAAAIGFFSVASEGYTKLKALLTDQEFQSNALKVYDGIKEKLEQATEKAKELNRQIQLAQAPNDAARKALEFQFKTADVKDAMQPIREVEVAINELQAKQKLMQENVFYRSPREMDRVAAELKNKYAELGLRVQEYQNAEAEASKTGVESHKAATEAINKHTEALSKLLEKYRSYIPQTGNPDLLSYGTKKNPLISSDLNGVQLWDWSNVFGPQQPSGQLTPDANKNGVSAAVQAHINQMEQMAEKWRETTATVRQFGMEVSRNIEQAALFGRSWSDALKAILIDVGKLIIQFTILKKLEKENGEGGENGGAGGFFTALVGGFAGKHASGGTIPAGMWGLVGEKGPELAYGGTSGLNITPNGRFGGVTQYFDMRGSIVTDDVVRRAELAGALRTTHDSAVRHAVVATHERMART